MHELAAQGSVGGQRDDHARVQRHHARLAELGLLDRQDAAVQIGIRVGQVDRFRNPKSGRCDQAEQRRIGGGTKAI